MAKLHELLAVETNLESQANKVMAELANTFEKKRHLFGEKRITFTASAEGAQPITEEQSDIQSTVAKEVEWVTGILAKALDLGHQIDMANTLALADVVTEDGVTVLQSVPATSLLQLEKRIKGVHDLVVAIPTLDQEWSSLITPALKSELLERCDILLRAIKKARSKANEQELEVSKHKIGKKLLEFIFQPLTA